MISRTVFTRTKGLKDQVWIYLNYYPTDEAFCVTVGYYHSPSASQGGFSEEKEYQLDEYLRKYPEWESKITDLKKEIEKEL